MYHSDFAEITRHISKMSSSRYGLIAEDIAVSYLKAKGYDGIIKKRFNNKYGEVDLIIEYRDVVDSSNVSLLFVEVKARRTKKGKFCYNGFKTDVISERQILRCFQGAEYFLSSVSDNRYCNAKCRFDLIIINNTEVIQHIENISIH